MGDAACCVKLRRIPAVRWLLIFPVLAAAWLGASLLAWTVRFLGGPVLLHDFRHLSPEAYRDARRGHEGPEYCEICEQRVLELREQEAALAELEAELKEG